MKIGKVFLISVLLLSACNEKKKEETPVVEPVSTVIPKHLYVSTGACYSGTNTTFTTATASNQTYRLSLTSGQKELNIADYFSLPANPGDSPVGLIDIDSSNMMIVVENASGRRIEKLPKAATPTRTIFSSNATALSAALKGIAKTSDGGYLIAKTAGIEKLTSQGIRMGTPYIGTALGATCGATNANINNVAVTSSGKIIYTNAAASNNRWGVISPNGYSSASDCLAAQTAPDVNAYPVAIQFIPSYNQVIVAYAGNSLNVNLNSIYVYDFNDSTNVISNATKIYDANTYVAAGYLLYGISAMVYNPDDRTLFVATAISNATTVVNYSIEKLNYNPDAKTLTRSSSVPFYSYGVDTKCISSLMIAE